MVKVKRKNIMQKKPKGKRGRPLGYTPPTPLSKKTVEQHIADGTYRPDRHGPRPLPKLLPKPEFKLPCQHVDTVTKRWIKSEADEKAVAEGYRFDERYPVYIEQCFEKYLRQSKGRWAGKPFTLIDWQRNDVIYPLFGWIGPDGYRRHRWVYIEIPKKNGKSTLASAVGIALLIFDGEPGAEVYSCASDKDQARIVHGEAINMLEASPELMQLVKINNTTSNVRYKAKHSFYKALASSIQGKEGYNIHGAIVDELHVWEGRLVWDALRYGFAARDQPVMFVITTAGEDMQSVCREQHNYAQGIINGSIYDPSYLGVIYTVEDEAKWNEEEQWHIANPSLGHTLKISEFRSSYNQLQVRPAEEPNFKRRRLNIWCTSTKVWLDSKDWADNYRQVSDNDLAGLFCSIGCDLARTRDTTSLVFDFPEYNGQKDNHFLRPFIFLPEDRIGDIKHLINDLPQWVKKGYVITTDGNVTDYDFIINHVVDWVDKHNINVHSIAFDPYNAEQFTRELADRLGCERFAFGQTIKNYAEPTEEFERLVIKNQMHHNGNQMMAWQFSHCLVQSDKGGRFKPVRYETKDIRTIDSCVSSVMAYHQSLEIDSGYWDETGGVY